MSFFPEIDLSAVEAETFARGLYAVARVDGVHERELALISDFYQGAATDEANEGTVAASLERMGVLGPKEVAQVLISAPQRELFVKTALLLTWADGTVSDAERAKVDEFARALEVAPEKKAQLEAEVKDFLLRPLAGLANVNAVSAVAKKLGM
jgi:tellurite resistance protein